MLTRDAYEGEAALRNSLSDTTGYRSPHTPAVGLGIETILPFRTETPDGRPSGTCQRPAGSVCKPDCKRLLPGVQVPNRALRSCRATPGASSIAKAQAWSKSI